MNAKFLKYISQLTDLPIILNDDNSNSADNVREFFENYYDTKSIKESSEMLERYQNMSKAEKDGLVSDFEKLELDISELFDFKDFQESVQQAKENCTKVLKLTNFFYIFQDNKIQSILPINDDDDDEIEDSNPNLPTLIQQFNFYQEPDFPIGFFLEINMIETLKEMIQDPLLKKLELIGNNIFIQYVLKEYINKNPSILFNDFIEYITNQLDNECKEKYSDKNFQQMQLSTFQTEIYYPFVNLQKHNSTFNFYDLDNISNTIDKLFKDVHPKQNTIPFITIIRIIIFTPYLDKIAESYRIFTKNKSLYENCPFFSFQMIENNKDINKFIESGHDSNSLGLKRLIDFNDSKLKDFAYILQPKMSLLKNYLYFLNALFLIFLSSKNPLTNIYDIIVKYFENDEFYSSLKSQANNSCVFGEKKEALYKMIFLIDWLKSGNNDFEKFNAFFISHCTFLNNSQSDFDIENAIQLITNNRQFFKEIIDGNAPVASLEYNYVMSVSTGEYSFAVDLNGVQLESPINDGKHPTVEYVKLKLIASSLNITMFESRGDFEFQKIATKFVSRFQLCEKLKTELKLLSNYYDKKSEAKLLFKLNDSEKEEEEEDVNENSNSNSNSLKSEIAKIVDARLTIEKNINDFYLDSMTYFTKEDLCLSYSYALQKDKENLKKIILSTINKISLKSDNFIDLEIDKIIKELGSKQGFYEEKIKFYLELLNNLIQLLITKEMYQTPKVSSNNETQISIISYKRRIMEKAISILLYNEYKFLPDLIFDLFFSLQNEMPNYNQILLCTKDTTINRVLSFLQFYYASNHAQKTSKTSNFKLFLLINPQYLESEASEYLLKFIKKYSSDILGLARLVILSTSKKRNFVDIYRFYNIDNIDNCKFTINKNYTSIISTDKTESFMIYTMKPRVGKSHLIMEKISNYKNNIYHRIIVDSTTTLTKLISLLNEAPVIENHTLCYHFNIEGSKNEQFTIYIIMLYLFGSLNDGFSNPFVLSNKCKTVFFFEFGSNPPMTEEMFIENVFPIGKYINKLQIPSDKEFFSLDEYCVSIENGHSTIVKKPFNRKYMLTTSALIMMRTKHGNKFFNAYFKNMKDDQMRQERDQLIEESKKDPKIVYDNLLSLFKQDWIPEKYRRINPLISQLDDVSHVIVNLIEFIFGFSIADQEFSLGGVPIRYMALSLAFETAVINCGLPYLYPEDNQGEIDKIRLDRVKEWIDSAERLLIVCGLNHKYEDGCGVRTFQHNRRVFHKKSISEEFGVKSDKILNELVYTSEKWQELEKDNIAILQELEAIFSLKRDGFLSTFTLCVSYWDKLTNNDKGSLSSLTNKNQNYFKELRETKNCNIKKCPQFYPEKPTQNCKFFVDLLANIFRQQREVPEIKDDRITTHAKAIDVIQQYVLTHTLLKTYSLTLHNIEMFLHIIYRIYSHLPIVMMGETGSGKTYSVRFLREIIGPLTSLEMRCFDGGTEESDIKKYVNENIEKFNKKNSIEEINKKNLQIIFFFDEVNTAPCQWFIKDLVIDRFLDGKKLPDYVKFICAMNPKRFLPDVVKQRLRGLDPKYQSEISNLVYKVRQMPESFVPYLFSADAPRKIPKSIEDVKTYEDLSEFEKVCEKVIDQKMNIEPLPLYTKTSTGIIHFSSSQTYSSCFDFKFFTQNNDKVMKPIYDTDTSLRTQLTHSFIARLNAYAGRLFIDQDIGIYKDTSFMSIREPERCVHLMRWFYKKGIYEFSQNNLTIQLQPNEIFRKSFMLAFAVTYWLRLSDYKLEKQNECDRDSFIKKIISKWNELINYKDFSFLKTILKPPTFDEWIKDTIKSEQLNYAKLFVNDDEGLSLNDALCENIWTTYVSLSNNIPLWIIGRPGTSKSLAVNIVLAKLFTGRTIQNLPTLVYQTFMCSSDSRSEALISQMSRIAEKSLLLPTKGSITALLLEEIGHADLSPYLPLKCLNHVIDDGFQVDQNTYLPITLIGLSNYKMDSAKLNRGILIIRDELSNEQKVKTAIDIFSSTSLSLFRTRNKNNEFDENEYNKFIERYKEKIIGITKNYHHANKADQFIGLRDFYGVIKLVTSVLINAGDTNMNRIIYAIKRNFSGDKTSSDLFRTSVEIFDTKQCNGKTKIKVAEPSSLNLIRDNLNEDWSQMKNPLSRHMLIVTEGNSALSLLISELNINSLIYADNFSGLPDDEWISNDLKQFAKSMTSGETIVFIGNHPCFNCLYDVFNLRYESIYGENFALLSFAGDSFLVKVHPRFKAIIIMEEKEYNTLPAPFLNRFEKLFLNYDSILSQDKKEASESYETFIKDKFPDFKMNASFRSLSKAPEFYFGCYNQHHFNAIAYCKDQIKLDHDEVDQLVFLNCQPSKLVVSMTKYEQNQVVYLSKILNKLSKIKTSILHLLYYYNNTELLTNVHSFALKIYNYWKNDVVDKLPGIQAMLLLPFYQEIKQEDFLPFGELISIQLSEKINEGLIYRRIKKCIKKCNKNSDNNNSKSIITLIEVQVLGENLQQRIFHLQAVFEKIRKELAKEKTKIPLHTFILIDMSVWENDLSFVQSIEWPIIFLDTCVTSNLKPLEKSLMTIDLSSLIFTPLKEAFPKEEEEEETKKKTKKKAKKKNENLINVDEFINIVKKDLLLIYSKSKQKLLSNSLSNEIVSDFLKSYFLYLISNIKSFRLCLSSSCINNTRFRSKRNGGDDEKNQPWFMIFLKTLYNPPPSLIEYLSVKLSRVAENIYSILMQTILSCANNFNPDLEAKNNTKIINFIFDSDLFLNKLENSISSESPTMYQIEYRYLNPENVPLWQLYTYMWEIVIYDPQMILNPRKVKNYDDEEEEEEEWKEEEEEEEDSEKVLTSIVINEFFEKQFNEFECENLINVYLKPTEIPDPFYASYILLICPGIKVTSKDRDKFNNLIVCIKKIVTSAFGSKLSLAKTMVFLLNQTLKSYLAMISQCYLFIPDADDMKFIKFKKNRSEDERIECIQKDIAIVAKRIIMNVFDHKFKNIIQLKEFFAFCYPVIRSLSLEFSYTFDTDTWDFDVMNSYMNVLGIFNLMFLLLPESVVLNNKMFVNKKLEIDVDKLPKSAKDVINLVDCVMSCIKESTKIDEKDVANIYTNLVSNYSNYMSNNTIQGFCDPELS